MIQEAEKRPSRSVGRSVSRSVGRVGRVGCSVARDPCWSVGPPKLRKVSHSAIILSSSDLTRIHLFSFAFGLCSITIRRHIRQFVIEQNNSINFIRDWPLCKTEYGRQFVNGHCKLDIVHNFRLSSNCIANQFISSNWFECGRHLDVLFGMTCQYLFER